MTIVTERINVNKPPPAPAPDPKSGKLAPGQINGGKDLEVEVKKEEPGFFSSFFPSKAKKKVGPVMEAVSISPCELSTCMALSVEFSLRP